MTHTTFAPTRDDWQVQLLHFTLELQQLNEIYVHYSLDLNGDAAVGAQLGSSPSCLPRCELGHAAVIGVVHVVVCIVCQSGADYRGDHDCHSRMGSTPPPVQVSRPVGHP